MKSSSSAHARGTKAFGIMVVASLLSGLLSSVTASAQSEAPTSAEPAAVPVSPQQTTKPPVALSQEEREKREEWAKGHGARFPAEEGVLPVLLSEDGMGGGSVHNRAALSAGAAARVPAIDRGQRQQRLAPGTDGVHILRGWLFRRASPV